MDRSDQLEREQLECLTCGSKDVSATRSHYMAIPGMVIVPAEYLLCDAHKDVRYDYYDIYDEQGNRKKIDHEFVINRSKELSNATS